MSGIINTSNELIPGSIPDLKDPTVGDQFYVYGEPIGPIINVEPIRTLIPDLQLNTYIYFRIISIDPAGFPVDTRQLNAIRSVLQNQFNEVELPRVFLVSIDQQHNQENGVVFPSYGVSGICQVGYDVLIQDAITQARLAYM